MISLLDLKLREYERRMEDLLIDISKETNSSGTKTPLRLDGVIFEFNAMLSAIRTTNDKNVYKDRR